MELHKDNREKYCWKLMQGGSYITCFTSEELLELADMIQHNKEMGAFDE